MAILAVMAILAIRDSVFGCGSAALCPFVVNGLGYREVMNVRFCIKMSVENPGC